MSLQTIKKKNKMNETYLNDKPLSAFGFRPGKHEGSNISLGGAWDLPKRTGDTCRQWREENFLEPFVDPDDLYFDERSIRLCGVVTGGNTEAISQQIDALRTFLANLTRPVTLRTKWGTWLVVVEKEIAVTWRQNRWAEVNITFTEPFPDLTHVTGAASALRTIDPEALKATGLHIERIGGTHTIAGWQPLKVTEPLSAGAYIHGGRDRESVSLEGRIVAGDYTAFMSRIRDLQTLFGSAGLKQLAYKGRTLKLFAPEGFQVTNVRVLPQTTAQFAVKLLVTA